MGMFTMSPWVTRAFVSACSLCSAWDKQRHPQQRASVAQKLAQACCSSFTAMSVSSSSPDQLSTARGCWPKLAASSVTGVPNTNKFEGRVQPGSQRFLSHFQTYYFLLFLESVHCAFKNKGPILQAAQWSILNSELCLFTLNPRPCPLQ